MKKYITILILLLACQAGHSQSMDQLFDDFARREDVTRVTIGPFMMKLTSLFTETMGVSSIEVLEIEKQGDGTNSDLRAALQELKDPNFEPLVTTNEGDSRTKIMVRIDKEMIRELVIATTDKGDGTLVRLKGKIKPSDIERVINGHKDGR